ncbi:MAG: site-specific integrase, partial [Dehalococcoidia bacterium]
MRAHGEGTISKRCKPECTRDAGECINHRGTWCGAYKGEDGQRKFVYAKTQREVQTKLREALRAKDGHRPVVAARLTVGHYLDGWLENTAKGRLRPSSYRSYEQMLRVHVPAALRKKPITQLTAGDVRALLNETRESGLSARSVQYLHAILRSAFNDGLSDRVLASNPAEIKRAVKVERSEVPALDPDQARTLLAAFAGDPLHLLVRSALATGLRQGELLGLQWDDVSFEESTIVIRRQLQRGELVELKTERSRRTLAISRQLLEALRQHRLTQQPISRFIFASVTGTPLDGTNVLHRFQARLKAVGLPKMRWHDLRHGTASLMLAGGANPRVVMEQLGHSQISLTMNTYAAVIPALQREASEALERAI